MKAIFSIVGVLFFININAQKFDCSSKTKEYQDLLQSYKMDAAYISWSDVVKNCPKESETIYTDGLKILQFKIENDAKEEKEKAVRLVLKLYDQYNRNFPLNTPDFEVNKAMALYNNKIDAKEEILGLLESAFAKNPQSITDANAIYLYFRLYYEKSVAADAKKIPAEKILDRYMQANSLLSQLEVTHPEKSDEYKTAATGIRALAKPLATCDNLAAYYQKNFDANKDNVGWLTAALENFSANCGSQAIYNTIAEANYKLGATSKSAYYMGIATVSQRKFPEAIQFFTEAESLETNPLEKAKLDYSLATGLLSNDKAKAKELLNKTLSLDPKMGKAYLFLAQLYANSAEECGKTAFEKKAVYYLATETIKKAAVVEPRLKPTVEKMTEGYASKSVTAKEITQQKMNGKSITIGCWINETVTFPAK